MLRWIYRPWWKNVPAAHIKIIHVKVQAFIILNNRLNLLECLVSLLTHSIHCHQLFHFWLLKAHLATFIGNFFLVQVNL